MGSLKHVRISQSNGVSFSQIVHGRVSPSISPNPDISSIFQNAHWASHPVESVIAVAPRVFVEILLMIGFSTATNPVIRVLSPLGAPSQCFTNLLNCNDIKQVFQNAIIQTDEKSTQW